MNHHEQPTSESESLLESNEISIQAIEQIKRILLDPLKIYRKKRLDRKIF